MNSRFPSGGRAEAGAAYQRRVLSGRSGFTRAVILTWACGVLAVAVLSVAPPDGPVVISEFMANDSRILPDEDDEASDWLELHNTSRAPVSLGGWFLTDSRRQLDRWQIPVTNLPPHSYLVIFASGKNRAVPGQPLHTSFRLGAVGEYLALVGPDGVTVTSEFAPGYPEQFDDLSFGIGMRVKTVALVSTGAVTRFRVARDNSEGAWMHPNFDDATWNSGQTGFGFAGGAALAGGGLYGYWPIQETGGMVASNLIPGGVHGVLNGGVRTTNDPIRGAVLSFNGRDGYVSAGTIPRMGATSNNFTWSLWYRQRSVPNRNAVILGNRSGGAPTALQFIKFTPSTFEYFHNGNIGFISHEIASGSWRHLAVVKAGTSLNYYDNGVLVGSARVGGDIEANPLYWGGDPGAPGEYVDGLIDDVSLWTRALSVGEIQSLHEGISPAWLSGPGSAIATDLASLMRGVTASAYFRIPFVAPEGETFTTLKLRVRYDDGFVAYLNGVEIARRNAPAALGWEAAATAENGGSSGFEEIEVSTGLPALQAGRNVLAIHGLNLSATDPDFFILPELEAASEIPLDWRYFPNPTPGRGNDEGYLGVLAEVTFDRPRGFYDAPFHVALACVTPDAVIRYTTDGTAPSDENGRTYESPLLINGTTILRAGAFKPGYYTKGPSAQSYLFLDEILVQNGAGLPNSWGNDWQMDPRVVTHAAYASRIRADMKSLPVVSIALDAMEFWGPRGIYTLTSGRGDAYERPCSAELFFPDGSAEGFQINCGIQIVGGASRNLTPKHGLGLSFKSRYGAPKLRYKLFDNSPVNEFDFIALRPNFNMSWVRTDNSGPLNNRNADGAERLHAIYVRDQFTKESQLAMGHPSAHERFVHLYINGIYWGLYNPSERTDSSFAASYLGGSKDEYDTIFSDSSTVARAHDGDKNAWLEMMGIARQGLATPDAYARIQQFLNVTNLADYMMLNFYCATVDWPWQNWNAARKRAPGAQFHFFIWDAEYTLETPPWVPDDRTDVGAASSDADSPARLYHELRQNPEWRLLFADRVQKHFFNDGALTTNQATTRFVRLCDLIDSAIVGESARWGDVVRRSQPYTRDVEWLAEKQRLLTQFLPQRTSRVIQQFIRAGLYPEVPAPLLSPNGGEFTAPFELTMHASSGTIFFTTDGTDPRLPGGSLAPQAQTYTGPIVVSDGARILARTWRTNSWSALNVASFAPAESAPALSVSLAAGGARLSWTARAGDYVLESTESLSAPAWNPVLGVVDLEVTVRTSERTRFYRLRRR